MYILLTANHISCWLCYTQQYVTFLPLSHSNSFKKGINSESSYGFILSKFSLFLLFLFLTSIFFNFMRISNYLSVPFHRCSTCLQFPNTNIPALSDHSTLRVKRGWICACAAACLILPWLVLDQELLSCSPIWFCNHGFHPNCNQLEIFPLGCGLLFLL